MTILFRPQGAFGWFSYTTSRDTIPYRHRAYIIAHLNTLQPDMPCGQQCAGQRAAQRQSSVTKDALRARCLQHGCETQQRVNAKQQPLAEAQWARPQPHCVFQTKRRNQYRQCNQAGRKKKGAQTGRQHGQ